MKKKIYKKSLLLINMLLLFFFVFNGCSSTENEAENNNPVANDLRSHLINLQKQNNRIELTGWDITQKFNVKLWKTREIGYTLHKNIGDTTYLFSFLYIISDTGNFYVMHDYIKRYYINNIYHEMAFLNNDTTYFFKYECIDKKEDKIPSKLREFNNFDFIVGKYYIMSKIFCFNSGQLKYFYNNEDSLTKVRGNNLPDLPGEPIPDSISLLWPEEQTIH